MNTSIEELRAAGLEVTHTSSSNGGEFHALCPYCRKATGNGGRDRLCVWPAKGRAWCRQCQRNVTIVSLLAELLGISEAHARKRLSIPAGQPTARREVVVEDREKWRAKVAELLRMGTRQLDSGACETLMDFLYARGLKAETIASAGLGGSPQDRYYLRDEFGLAAEIHPDTGKPRKLCLPKGILIPYFDADGVCVKLQSRCEEDAYGRYRVLPGSEPASMVLLPKGPVRVVVSLESALDALLCHQEVPKDYAFVALGSTSSRPDARAEELFREAPRLLIATDSDDAGAVAYRRLLEHFSGANRLIVPPDLGKDVGDAFVRGLDIREWCALGVELAEEKPPTGNAARKSVSPLTVKRPVMGAAKPKAPKATAAGGFVELHAPGKSLEIPFVVVRSVKEAGKVIKELRKAKVVSIDIETAPLPEHAGEADAALDPWRSRPRLLQAIGMNQAYVFDLHAVPLAELAPLFEGPWAAHNAVFDLKHLVHAGLSPRTPYCTMLMDNAVYNRLLALDELCAVHFSMLLDKTEQTSDWGKAELSPLQLQYAALDVFAMSLLGVRLKKEVVERDRSGICQLMHEAQLAIAAMELNGLGFDAQAHGKLLRVWTRKRKASLAALLELSRPDLNPNSSQQVAELFEAHATPAQVKAWPRTKSGQLSTAADELAAFLEIPVVAAYLEYAKWNGHLNSFGLKLVEQLNPVTQRLHPHFRIAGASTGRMSASAPNVQGLPNDPEFRALFVPQPGYTLVRADYNQMQLRIAAMLSGDAKLLTAYEQGLDVHRLTAARVLGKQPDEVISEERNLAKAIGFGILFGMGAERLRCYAASDYGVVVSLPDAKRIRDRFFENYPEVRRWQQEQVAEAKRTGCSVTPMGRVRNFTREEKDNFHTAALNTPIQGAEGEVMLAALALLPKALDPYDALIVNCVHDELLVECPDEHVAAVAKALRDCMEQAMLRVFPKATLKGLVEVGHGPSWGAAK